MSLVPTRTDREGGDVPVYGPRGPDDDFVCHRFEVWYASIDCAIRTKFRTCPACGGCAQGRFNLERHRAALARVRPPDLD